MRRKRRPRQREEPSIYRALDNLVARGHRQGASLAKEYAEVLGLLRARADNNSSQGTAPDDEQRRLWANLVTVHAWLLRDLLHACRRHAAVPAGERAQEERYFKLSHLATAANSVMNTLREQLERPGATGARIGSALVRSGSLQCYSQLLAAWPSGIPVEPVLISAASACGLCGLAALHDAGRTGLYAVWMRALADSQLLEHAARVLVRLEEEATEKQRAGVLLGNINKGMDMALGVVDLPLQYSEVRCLLSGRPGPYAAFEAEFVAALPAVRSVLSGPCLQYWLGRRLLVAELRAAGTARCHGLPDPSRLVAAPWAMGAGSDCERCLTTHLLVTSTAWYTIAAIPLDLPEALAAAAADAAGDDGADGGAVMAAALAVVVARRRQPPPLRLAGDGFPYSAAHVYDLTHGALAAALRGGTAPASIQLLRPIVLLVRLALERLRPVETAARLPCLWRVALSFLRSVDAAEGFYLVHAVHPNLHTLVLHLGRLLWLDLREGTPPSGEACGQAEGGAQAEAAGTAAAGPAPGCSFSLRCALEAGFLPAVEQLLRRLAALLDATELFLYAVNCLLRSSGVWPAVLAHGSVREVTSLILTLRKATWFTSNASLDCLRRAEDEDLMVDLPQPQEDGDAQGLGSAYFAALMEQLYTVLLPLQFLGPLGKPEAGSTCSGNADGSRAGSSGANSRNAYSGGTSHAGSAGADSGRITSGGTGSGGADRYLALNNALEAGRFAGHGWLERAGGRPAHGSPAAEQQRMLASFALAQWLPLSRLLVGPGALWSHMVQGIQTAWLTLVVRQCLSARLRVSQAAAASGNVADDIGACAASADTAVRQEWLELFQGNTPSIGYVLSELRGALASQPGPDAVIAWSPLLLSFWSLRHLGLVIAAAPVEVALQVACQIMSLCDVEADENSATCSQSPQGTESAVRAWAAAAAASADRIVDTASEQPADASGACSHACAVASVSVVASSAFPGDPVGRAQWLRSLLLQGGWGRLVAVLDAALPLLTVEAGASGEAAMEAEAGRGLTEGDATGASGPSGSDTTHGGGTAAGRPSSSGGTVHGEAVASARSALIALLDDLALKLVQEDDFAGLTDLPPLAAALRAAKAAGVVPCGNPVCCNLKGPSEAVLPCCKTCSRCRAVSYCSGACQLAHWQAGQREGCPGSAVPSGSVG